MRETRRLDATADHAFKAAFAAQANQEATRDKSAEMQKPRPRQRCYKEETAAEMAAHKYRQDLAAYAYYTRLA